MPCLRTPSTSSTPNALEPTQADLLEVQRAPLPAARGRGRRSSRACPGPSAPAPPPRTSPAWRSCRRPRRSRRGGTWGCPSRPSMVGLEHPARPRGQLSRPSRASRPRRNTRVGAEPLGQRGLRVEAGHHADLHVGVEGAEDRDRARPERAGAPDERPGRPAGGGWRVTLWSDTAKGSAKMACSSSTPAGTAKSIDEWAGRSSAYPPVASLETPVCRPGLMSPVVKLQHRLRSPAAQAGHSGSMPRGAQDSHGLSTTRCPISNPDRLGAERGDLGHHLVARAPAGTSTGRSSRCRCRPRSRAGPASSPSRRSP